MLSDIGCNKARSLLAIAAMALGTFGTGTVLTAYSVLTREIQLNFMSTHPASAILEVQDADAKLARKIVALDSVARAEARGFIEARFESKPDIWRRIQLFIVDDFDALSVSTFKRETGDWPPAQQQILVERSAMPFVEKQLGDLLRIETPNGERRELRIGGVTHDPGQSPGWVDGMGYAYLTRETLALFGESTGLNQLRIIVSQNPMDRRHCADVAYEVKQVVQQLGYEVGVVIVPRPGAHPHADQMLSLLFLLQAFALLSLLLGGVLVGDIISALLARQVREIGSMKAMGASVSQIAGMYLFGVLLLALAALLPGMFAGLAAGLAYARFVSGILNFNLTSAAVPGWVPALQALVALGVPLVAAAFPVLRGVRIPVHDAINDYGLGNDAQSQGRFDLPQRLVRWLGRPTLLSLRNTLRQKGRLALTVGILAIGGATFMSAINVSLSWTRTVDNVFEARRYDLQTLFTRSYPIAAVENIVSQTDGVKRSESWLTAWAERPPRGADPRPFRFLVTGVPPASKMLDLPLLEGRWLQAGDTHAMVVNHELLNSLDAGMKLGDEITLDIAGKPTSWRIVGAVREIGVRRRGQSIPGSAYVNIAQLGATLGRPGQTNNVVLRAHQSDQASLEGIAVRLERAFDRAQFLRVVVKPSSYRRKELIDHLLVIQTFLLAMGALVAAVGGFALASTMSITVMQRTRELAVMRALGASKRALLRIIVVEGLTISLLSWILATLLSIPLSRVIGNQAGHVFVHADLDNVFSAAAILVWLGIVVLLGVGLSIVPALRSIRQPVHQGLSYQ